jgi:hypothetical protein
MIAALRITPLAALDHTATGPKRGYAHIGLPDHPASAPGHLDFAPLQLFAMGEVHPGEGFPMHRHENIENVTVILQGCFRHADSLGNACTLHEDELAVFSAGSGAEHAEHVVGDVPVRAAVIWLRPDRLDATPSFRRARFARRPRARGLVPLASGRPDLHPGALPLRCDATLFHARLRAGDDLTHALASGRRAYLIALDGALELDDQLVEPGARALAEGPGTLRLHAPRDTEILLIDMAAPA